MLTLHHMDTIDITKIHKDDYSDIHVGEHGNEPDEDDMLMYYLLVVLHHANEMRV